jgi:16S rRNA (cytosine1402-N4)-methyltransferase
MSHIPVLGLEAVMALQPNERGLYIDATFGRGGYCALLFERNAGRVVAIDRDVDAIAFGQKIFADKAERLTLLRGCFGDMKALLQAANINQPINGIVFDIGVSSPQVDTPERGFSFRHDGPLDMRMGSEGQTAADIINNASESEIADILYNYGEERASRKIARAICNARLNAPILRTTHLASIIASVLPKKDETHPATKSFQALRIAVNDELGELQRGLAAAMELIAPMGRIAVVTFHSLEDRIVKNAFRQASGRVASGSRHRPLLHVQSVPQFKLVHSKAITPTNDEIRANPRARSAKLRVLERLEVSHAS